MRQLLVAVLAAVTSSGCLYWRINTVSSGEGVASQEPAPPQALHLRFNWPQLSGSSVDVNQVDLVNGRQSTRRVERFQLVHSVGPGAGSVSFHAQPGSEAPTDLRAFDVGISRLGHLLDPDASSAKPLNAVTEEFGFTSSFLWSVWVEQWNDRDFPTGQPVTTTADFWDERFGHSHFNVTLTPVGFVECSAAPGGWCVKLRAVYAPDDATLNTIVATLSDRDKRRTTEDVIRAAQAMEFQFDLQLEPETMLPHRVDVQFKAELIVGPDGRTSIVSVLKKLTMNFTHSLRAPAPAPSGPQDQPRRRVPASQVLLPGIGVPSGV